MIKELHLLLKIIIGTRIIRLQYLNEIVKVVNIKPGLFIPVSYKMKFHLFYFIRIIFLVELKFSLSIL